VGRAGAVTQGKQRSADGERDFKKGQSLLCERNEVKYRFIKGQPRQYPVRVLYRVMGVGKSAYYNWLNGPPKLISAETLHLYRRAKALFKASRESLVSRELAKKLREEGFKIGRHRTRTLMRKLNLKVDQRVAYKVTTKHKHSDQVADNLLNQNINPVAPNEVWAGDVTYLRTAQGWMYLAVVMDLYSRCIVGWHLDKRMTTDLVGKAMIKAVTLRQPKRGLVFHSDRGSQCTSKWYRRLLKRHGIRASMGDVGACWDTQCSILASTLIDMTRAGIGELPLR